MSSVNRTAVTSKQRFIRKNIDAVRGKENAPPSTINTGIKSSNEVCGSYCAEESAREENVRKRRLSLTSTTKENKRGDIRPAPKVVKTTVRKTPFNIHIDEKFKQHEPPSRKEVSTVDTNANKQTNASKVSQNARDTSVQSKIPTKVESKGTGSSAILSRSQSVRSIVESVSSRGKFTAHSAGTGAKRIISKKPALLQDTNEKSRINKKPIEETKTSLVNSVHRISGTGSRLPTSQARNISSIQRLKPVGLQLKKSNEATIEKNKSSIQDSGVSVKSKAVVQEVAITTELEVTKRERDSGLGEASSSNLTTSICNVTKNALDGKTENSERCLSAVRLFKSVITPSDGQPPAPLMPIKALIRETKHKANKDNLVKKKEEIVPTDLFPIELAYHLEYQDDLLEMELEKESRSLPLSSDFLRKHINANQRKQVISYLLHLGSHCRFASFIIYQTVKLFDIAMDRIVVSTDRIQLTALAALWISLKRLEIYCKLPLIDKILSLAKELYEGREDLLLRYERKVLAAVNFNISFSDPFCIASHFILNCKRHIDFSGETTAQVYTYSSFMIDLTLLDERFCRVEPSLVALIAVELAFVLAVDCKSVVFTEKPRWKYWRILFLNDSTAFDSFKEKEIILLRSMVIRSIRNSGNKRCGYDVVYKKYERSRYGRISSELLERARRLQYFEIAET